MTRAWWFALWIALALLVAIAALAAQAKAAHPELAVRTWSDLAVFYQAVRALHLSNSSELPLRLRWIALLSGRLRASLAASGGVHTAQDAIKAVMAGARPAGPWPAADAGKGRPWSQAPRSRAAASMTPPSPPQTNTPPHRAISAPTSAWAMPPTWLPCASNGHRAWCRP